MLLFCLIKIICGRIILGGTMVIQLGDYEFEVLIERKKIKNMYFRFKDNNILYVTCNKLFSENKIRKMILDNEGSLLRMYKKVSKREDANKQFHYLGEPLTKVFDKSVKGVSIVDGMLYAKDEKAFDKWYKEQCLRVFNDRIEYCLEYFNDIPEFSLRLRNMKTRWGVNNVTQRIITLNTQLLQKDISLIDYVIVHELCHFYEANHSSRFWNQVEKRYPDYKLARKRLRS